MPSRPTVALLGLLAASVLCIVTLELRVHHTGDDFYDFLLWNLFLAWVPLAVAAAAYTYARRRVDAVVVLLLVLWLLFFPNAPYMVTDFVHLTERARVPLWYDALMLSAFAWTAMFLGFASLLLVQLTVRPALGSAWSWLVVTCALVLGSFGVFLGRFSRINSWDALSRPRHVAHVVHERLIGAADEPRTIAVLLLLTAFLFVGYLIVYAFAGIELALAPRRRADGEAGS